MAQTSYTTNYSVEWLLTEAGKIVYTMHVPEPYQVRFQIFVHLLSKSKEGVWSLPCHA